MMPFVDRLMQKKAIDFNYNLSEVVKAQEEIFEQEAKEKKQMGKNPQFDFGSANVDKLRALSNLENQIN